MYDKSRGLATVARKGLAVFLAAILAIDGVPTAALAEAFDTTEAITEEVLVEEGTSGEGQLEQGTESQNTGETTDLETISAPEQEGDGEENEVPDVEPDTPGDESIVDATPVSDTTEPVIEEEPTDEDQGTEADQVADEENKGDSAVTPDAAEILPQSSSTYTLTNLRDSTIGVGLQEGQSLAASFYVTENSFAYVRVVISGRDGSAKVSLRRDGLTVYTWDVSAKMGPSYVSPLALPAGSYQLIVESESSNTVVEKLGYGTWSREGGIEHIEHEPNSFSDEISDTLVSGEYTCGSLLGQASIAGILEADCYTMVIDQKSYVTLTFEAGNLLTSLVKGDAFDLTLKYPDGHEVSWGGMEDNDGSVKKAVSSGHFYCGKLEPGTYRVSIMYSIVWPVGVVLAMSDAATSAAIKAKEESLMYVLSPLVVPCHVNQLSNCGVEVAEATYSGEPVTPAVKVVDPATGTVVYETGSEAALNKYYQVTYENNDQAGTGIVHVQCTLPDNQCPEAVYRGSISKEFTIAPAVEVPAVDISQATVTGIVKKTYTGNALKQSITVTVDGQKLVNGTDYTVAYKNNVKAGTASVVITGKGAYTGSITKKFTIAKRSIGSAKMSGVKAKYNSTGKAIKPVPTVKIGSKTLKRGTDYVIAYKNNVKPGTATITIAGRGNYCGTKKVTFAIATTATIPLQEYLPSFTTVKKATVVRKGTTNLRFRGKEGYIKFTAPTAGTYTFTVSNVKMNGKYEFLRNCYGHIYVQNAKGSWLKVRTQGGTTTGPLNIASSGYAETTGKLLTRPIASRYAQLKLKKGQTIYLYVYTTSLDYGATATLTIK